MYKDYWTTPSKWPRETRTHVPMAMAVLRIGEVAIDGWSGTETHDAKRLTPGLRPFEIAARDDRCRAHALLSEAGAEGYLPQPNFTKLPSNFTGGAISHTAPLPDYRISAAEYEHASRIIAEKNAPWLLGANRLSEARTRFLRAATMGEFLTAARDRSGFEMVSLDPDAWSVVHEHNVFLACTIDPRKPASIYIGSAPVMVERDSFDACLKRWRGLRAKSSTGGTDVPRSINDPIGPMNSDVRRAIATTVKALESNKMATETSLYGAVKASGNPLSRRAFDQHVIAAARKAANAPPKRGPRSRTPKREA